MGIGNKIYNYRNHQVDCERFLFNDQLYEIYAVGMIFSVMSLQFRIQIYIYTLCNFARQQGYTC